MQNGTVPARNKCMHEYGRLGCIEHILKTTQTVDRARSYRHLMYVHSTRIRAKAWAMTINLNPHANASMPMGGFRIWIRSSALPGTSVTHAQSEYIANCNLWAAPEIMRGKKLQHLSFQKICFLLFICWDGRQTCISIHIKNITCTTWEIFCEHSSFIPSRFCQPSLVIVMCFSAVCCPCDAYKRQRNM